MILNKVSANCKRAVVAMSGGVDSSVAAVLLKKEGYDLIGVSLQVWDYSRSCATSTKTCCSPRDFQDARLVASKIGIPFYVFDLEIEFEQAVIKKFIKSYAKGLTPSPCIDCNVFVKFGSLLHRTEQLGYGLVATGHYARIIDLQGKRYICRPTDLNKDQSYFLYAIKPNLLDRLLFPLGNLKKDDVRRIAREHGLVTSDKHESQDLCFLSGSVGEFLKKHLDEDLAGVIRYVDGRVIGFTENIYQYTIGQRKGLKVNWTNPLYVIQIDSENKAVIVGERDFLDVRKFVVSDWVWHAAPKDTLGLIQVRSRHSPVKCLLKLLDSNSVRIELLEERQTVITPGQAAVLYDESNSYILGGGIISGWIQG